MALLSSAWLGNVTALDNGKPATASYTFSKKEAASYILRYGLIGWQIPGRLRCNKGQVPALGGVLLVIPDQLRTVIIRHVSQPRKEDVFSHWVGPRGLLRRDQRLQESGLQSARGHLWSRWGEAHQEDWPCSHPMVIFAVPFELFGPNKYWKVSNSIHCCWL